MRLLIALPDRDLAFCLQNRLETELWEVVLVFSGTETLMLLKNQSFDLLLMHACLPDMDGLAVGAALERLQPVCPPRILLLCPYEMARPSWADCTVVSGASPEKLVRLLNPLMQKTLPALAERQHSRIAAAVDGFLRDIALDPRLKGYAYVNWLVQKLVPSPLLEAQPIGRLYQSCAAACGATPSSVERCVRVAIESVFIQGSMRGIEHYFGATVDPERGKPTNRAFLLQAAQQLRLRLTP